MEVIPSLVSHSKSQNVGEIDIYFSLTSPRRLSCTTQQNDQIVLVNYNNLFISVSVS